MRLRSAISARLSACSVRQRLSSVRPGRGLTLAGTPLSRCLSRSICCDLSPSWLRQRKGGDEGPARVQRLHAIFSNSLRTLARRPHEGQRKKLHPPPLGKRICQRPTSRDTPAIVTRTRAKSSLTSPRARIRETETAGRSSCVSLMAHNASDKVSGLSLTLRPRLNLPQRRAGTEAPAPKTPVSQKPSASLRRNHSGSKPRGNSVVSLMSSRAEWGSRRRFRKGWWRGAKGGGGGGGAN